MMRIRQVEPGEAKGRLKEIYDKVVETRGKVANIYKAQSLKPEVIESHLELYLDIMYRGKGLGRRERELLGVAVSSTNDCGY